MAKRARKAKKLAALQAKGLPTYPCLLCKQLGVERIFATQQSLNAHVKDSSHKPKAKGAPSVPVTVSRNGRNIITYPNNNEEFGEVVMVVDFMTPHKKFLCKGCGAPDAIPLTGYCDICDPVIGRLNTPKEEVPNKVTPFQAPVVMGPVSLVTQAQTQTTSSRQATLGLPPPPQALDAAVCMLKPGAAANDLTLPDFLDRRPIVELPEIARDYLIH